MKANVRLLNLLKELNERQRTYLLAIYKIDQENELHYQRMMGPRADSWRWIEYGPIGSRGLGDGREVRSLFIRMTKDGRKVSRLLLGEMVKPNAQACDLSVSALRLIEFGQLHPDKIFKWSDPWKKSYRTPEYRVISLVIRGLIKRGLISEENPDELRITELGKRFNVYDEPNWRPLVET